MRYKNLLMVLAGSLVVTSGNDRIFPTAESLQLASDIPDAELVVFPDCGHTPPP